MRGSCVLAVLTPVGVIALCACREEVEAPTAPGGPEETPAFATAAALSFRQVSVGGASSFWEHTCGVTTDNRAYRWGFNERGQLGTGTNQGPQKCSDWPRSLRPVPVLTGLRFDHVSAGGLFTCGITTDDRAYCWGDNFAGQLGDGTNTDHLLPTPVAGPI
jgi:alpha-tubulin suppressor-like RCC1 family protein